MKKSESKPVVVVMSGGVDSSVSAYLLKRDGYAPVGVSMQVWDYRNHGGSESRATCCAPSDFCDARMVADTLGIPFYVFDFEQSFRRKVIDQFIASYRRGVTPNPCIECNSKIKFAELRERALKLGIDTVATGHYARIIHDENGYRLARGRDSVKDQSYFLYRMTQPELAHTLFPVGEMSKSEVREHARQAGLATAEKAESQDICFVSGSIADFLRSQGETLAPGPVVSSRGEVVGGHDGAQRFTVGQRRGLGIGGAKSGLYVLNVDPAQNVVVVGEKSELERESFDVIDLHWNATAGLPEGESIEAIAQLRHRHSGVPVTVTACAEGRASVRFSREFSLPTPGQAAVFYDLSNQTVLGGGTIA